MQPLLWIGVGIATLVAIVVFVVLFNYFQLWFQALLSNAKVGLPSIIAMRFRKVNPTVIVINKIRLVKAGVTELGTDDLENHYLAGGNVSNVVSALIAASNAKIELAWNVATAIDLAGRDILDAVNTSVNPKVIECPNPQHGRPRSTRWRRTASSSRRGRG